MVLEREGKEIEAGSQVTTQVAAAEEQRKKDSHLTEVIKEDWVELEQLILETHTRAVEAAEVTMALEQHKLQAVEVGVMAVQVVEDKAKAMLGITAVGADLEDLRVVIQIMAEMDSRE
jgi:hypothetical protein